MSESKPLIVRVLEAASTLEALQLSGGVTNREKYSPRELRNLAAMMKGARER
jgi:hypothetical protein